MQFNEMYIFNKRIFLDIILFNAISHITACHRCVILELRYKKANSVHHSIYAYELFGRRGPRW